MSSLVFGPGVVKGTGTEWGPHFYETASLCVRQAFLNRQKKASQEKAENDDESIHVGTLFHAAMKFYHTEGALSKELTIPIGEAATPETREALRLYLEYRRRFEPDHFGKVLEAEMTLPKTEAEAKNLEIYFNGPVTMQADLIVDMSMEDVKRLTLTGLPYLRPGLWIVDFKTMSARPSSKDPIFGSSYLYSLQAAAYMVIARALSIPVEGFIVSGIVRHKEMRDDSFFQLVRPYYPGRDEQMVKHLVSRVYKQWEESQALGFYPANPGACHFKFNKPCQYLNNGCDQY